MTSPLPIPVLLRSPAWRRGAAALLLALGPAAAAAETPVERGDVLRIEVMNAPEFSRQAPVDADGRVALAVIGTVPVAGRDTATIGAEIAAAFVELDVLTAPIVLVEVVSYRQVYVGGNVGRPGAIDFVPGMTVRQAIVTAGGARLAPADATVSSEDALAAMGERRAAAFRLAQVAARIARIEAELAGAAALAEDAAAVPVASAALRAAAARSEASLLADEIENAAAHRDHVTNLLGLIDHEIDTLNRQADLQDTETKVQQAEIDDARTLVERGVMPRTRLQELLSEMSQLNSDRLETSASVARAQQQAERVRFELSAVAAERREALRLDLQAAERERAVLQAEIEALDLRILSAGVTSRDAATTRVVIHRNQGGRPTDLAVTMDDPVMPGDVIDLVLDLTTAALPAEADAADRALARSLP